ncbi:MAG TPA: hypothetical protein VFV93_18955, partial [Thermomicrobiales bacterium]|nr:hypothetical protein [Thermomicrobiales bacterium]
AREESDRQRRLLDLAWVKPSCRCCRLHCWSPSGLLFSGDDRFVNHTHSMREEQAGHIPHDNESRLETG